MYSFVQYQIALALAGKSWRAISQCCRVGGSRGISHWNVLYVFHVERNIQRSDVASLALAELKMADTGRYASRIESLEGGADYVAASIVDSLLLDRLDRQPTSRHTEEPKRE